ncbi:uncharacterized protein EDB93DRAFT_1311778 [Suillus bovinus]|uniref:uncharacterized protein n=1 Tax=Suillus bovinus TaxID=48563 RepID=UPI001B87D7B7|nr:uncharacterized protein EDB93DRAFT_1311778 [Suillus bovinus]KAG2131235.1 hypothetical protein EDB93DRAFT_1311778 [Suillus bovinus]
MTLSTGMTITVRVAVTGFLSVSCFRRVVVDNTAQVPIQSRECFRWPRSISLIAFNRIDGNNRPPQPRVLIFVRLATLSPRRTSTANACPSIPAPLLYPITTTQFPDVFLDDGAWDADDYDLESLSNESTVHKDDRSEIQPQKDHALEHVLDILIAKMTVLTLDDPPRPSKLRPLILVNRHKTSKVHCPPPAYSVDTSTRRLEVFTLSDSPSTDPGVALPGPGYPINMPTRIMEALSLGDRPSSTSKLKPLILVMKHATPHLKLPPLTTTVLRQPRSKTTMRSQTDWPFPPNPTICTHPQPS